jgi:hypothetical protein
LGTVTEGRVRGRAVLAAKTWSVELLRKPSPQPTGHKEIPFKNFLALIQLHRLLSPQNIKALDST